MLYILFIVNILYVIIILGCSNMTYMVSPLDIPDDVLTTRAAGSSSSSSPLDE